MADNKNLEHKLLKTIQALNNINASVDVMANNKLLMHSKSEDEQIESTAFINTKIVEENIILKNRIAELQSTISAVNKEVKDLINEINILTKV